MSGFRPYEGLPAPPPGPAPDKVAELAERWRGKADIIRVDEGVQLVAVMRMKGCPQPAILLAENAAQLESQLTEQTEGT